jgi:hypothetical protein
MFDEDIQKAARNKKMRAVSFDAEYLDDLVDNFRSSNPVSVILTGTAGDGKTFYCRRVWEALGGDSTIWARKNKMSTLFLPHQNRQLVVIKDLSELNLEDARQILPQVAESITNQDTEHVYLIAANDGQLMEKWREIPSTPLIDTVRRIVEDLLVNEQREKENVALRLYNLSHLPIKNLFPRVLNAVVQHEGKRVSNAHFMSQPMGQNVARFGKTSNASNMTKSRASACFNYLNSASLIISIFQ